MYIKDFDTTERKLQTLQKYLSSTFGYEVSADKSNAGELLEATRSRLETETDEASRARLLLVAETLKDVPAVAEAMREEIGQEEAAAFEQSAGDALVELTSNIKTTRESIQTATSTAQGNAPVGGTDMDAAVDAEVDVDVDADVDADFGDTGDMPDDTAADADDVFGGDEAASGGDEPLGRGMKEENRYESALHELRNHVANGKISRRDLEEVISRYRG
jgi:hypothetical protein